MNPIYRPKGRAGEYGKYALNIYTGCNHGCTYCYSEKMARRWRKDFTNTHPRDGLIDATKDSLRRLKIKGEYIHLCFTCDPYPSDIDTSTTREVIKAIKNSGNHVQILTKGGRRAERDFDLLDKNDWFGVTISGGGFAYESKAAGETERLKTLQLAKERGIKTWVSCEPVIDPETIIRLIKESEYIDLFRIGMLNYEKSDIDWKEFGVKCEKTCKSFGRNYKIKADLRRKMNGGS